jgi:hypothetical protein
MIRSNNKGSPVHLDAEGVENLLKLSYILGLDIQKTLSVIIGETLKGYHDSNNVD